eukprot:366071-Chlamydomonas_euryale.AAC.8
MSVSCIGCAVTAAAASPPPSSHFPPSCLAAPYPPPSRAAAIFREALSALTTAQAAFGGCLRELYDGGVADDVGAEDVRPFTDAMADVTEYIKLLSCQVRGAGLHF